MSEIIPADILTISGSGFESLRKKALETLHTFPIPNRKTEDYKYTPIARNLLKNFPELTSDVSKESETNDILNEINLPEFDTYTITLINGIYHEELSSLPASAPVKPLIESDNSNGPKPGSIAAIENDFFVSLNTIQFQQGIHFDIPASTEIDKPISILNITDSRDGKILCSPRILISLAENSKAVIYEMCYSVGENISFNNTVTEIFADKTAAGNYSILELNSHKTDLHHSCFIHQLKDSIFNVITITLGGNIIRNNPHISLDDETIESHLYGLYILNKDQHADNHTTVDHRKPNSFSNELYKGIMKEKSTGVFNGKIYVRPDAQKTNAYQTNKNILLSDDASIYTKPQLEIWADDVKCSHGCTTGQLDAEQIFYLQSRGIDKATAISMVLQAFQHDILDKLPDTEVIEYLNEIISKKLGKAY